MAYLCEFVAHPVHPCERVRVRIHDGSETHKYIAPTDARSTCALTSIAGSTMHDGSAERHDAGEEWNEDVARAHLREDCVEFTDVVGTADK